MINFTREQKGRAFDKLSKDIKGVVTSDTFIETFQKIGKDQGLAIDKIGILADVTIFTMLNLLPRQDFVKNLQKELGVSDEKIQTIANSVNQEVFLKIRELLQKESNTEYPEDTPIKEPIKEETANEQPNPERDQIMHDIEHPQPTLERGAKPITDPSREIATRLATDSFITDKLSTPSASATGTTTAKTLVNPEAPSSQKKYSADPYREPLS